MSNIEKKKDKTESTEDLAAINAPKVKFTIYIFPETMKTIDSLFKADNCVSKTAFIEKAIRFYCGYLLQNKPELIDYLAPQICTITDGIIKGSEQRLARAIFKLAVEVGVQTHVLAAINDFSEGDLGHMRNQVIDEVRKINGIINFEAAQRYQRS